jgi:Mn-containing catalase
MAEVREMGQGSEGAVDTRTTSTSGDPDMMQELLIEQLADLLNAEAQLVKALPKMERAASTPRLKRAFAEHLAETQRQVERLKEVFVLIGADPESKTCKGMTGLLEEGEEVIEEGEQKDAVAADLALIAAAQKVEHYEISAYGTARTMAGQAGLPNASMLLATSLAEEQIADNLLTQIARELMSQSGDGSALVEDRMTEKDRSAPSAQRNGKRNARNAKSKN